LVFAQLWEPVRVPAGVKEAGVELAEVLEELCVLDVPPLTVGWTLMPGWTSTVGWTLIVG
jgi:hypothetical protein